MILYKYGSLFQNCLKQIILINKKERGKRAQFWSETFVTDSWKYQNLLSMIEAII